MTARPGASISTASWRRSWWSGPSRRSSTASSTPRSARALNSTGGIGSQTQGFFGGTLDEARIWNVARSAAQILDREGSGDRDARPACSDAGASTTRAAACSTRPATASNGTLSGANCTFVAGRAVRLRRPTPRRWSTPARISRLRCRQPRRSTARPPTTASPVAGLTTTWSKVSGPGTVTFGNASALDHDGQLLDGRDVCPPADGERQPAVDQRRR